MNRFCQTSHHINTRNQLLVHSQAFLTTGIDQSATHKIEHTSKMGESKNS